MARRVRFSLAWRTCRHLAQEERSSGSRASTAAAVLPQVILSADCLDQGERKNNDNINVMVFIACVMNTGAVVNSTVTKY